MKNKIQTILENEYSASIKLKEIIHALNIMYIREAQIRLSSGNLEGGRAISSLIID